MALIYKSSKLFIFTSNYEIFGMVLLEAMYFSVPVISSWNGGSSVLIDDGVNGFILDTFDVEKWVCKIRYLKENPEQYNLLRKNAYKKISEKFLWDRLAVHFIEGYKKAIKQWEENNF